MAWLSPSRRWVLALLWIAGMCGCAQRNMLLLPAGEASAPPALVVPPTAEAGPPLALAKSGRAGGPAPADIGSVRRARLEPAERAETGVARVSAAGAAASVPADTTAPHTETVADDLGEALTPSPAADEPHSEPAAEAGAAAAPVRPRRDAFDTMPGFSDDVRLSQSRDFFRADPFRDRPGPPNPSPNRADTDLGRPRAERAGEGGGPNRIQEEEEEEEEEEFPKPDLLVRALGLEDSPFQIFGWVQGSFTANPRLGSDDQNFGVNPNNLSNVFMLNQIYIVAEKQVEQEDELDWGFRFDNLFGTDWSQFHDVGLFDHAFRLGHIGYDPVQMYGEIHLPFFTEGGVDIKGGRFYALPGYEDGPAPSRPLLSTGYLFSFAHPFTHFGMMSTWHVSDQLNLYNGAVNGWDRFIDERFKWGYAGAASYDSKDGRTNLTLTFNWGPNQFSSFFPANFQLAPNGVTQPPFLAGRLNPRFDKNDTLLFTAILIHEWNDDLTTILEADEGFTNNVPGAGPDGTYANANWYGLGGWALYDFTDRLTGVYRGEVFRDQGGIRTGFDDTFYEMTLGMIYRPYTWFWVRPEVRWDWATGPDKPYINETSRFQFTFGLDAIFLF